MQGTITVTPAGAATVHTYTAPETGWRANSHVIELASQAVLFDVPLTEEYAGEVLTVADSLGKPLTRLYISHAHPDHFAGAALIEAPSYAPGPVKDLIDRSGDLRIQRGYACTPGHTGVPLPRSRPVDHAVAPGAEETLDGIRLRFEAVPQAETDSQLTIALPDAGVLITQDVLYNGVHMFLGEHAFDAWNAAITALEALPYETIIPGTACHAVTGCRTAARSTPPTASISPSRPRPSPMPAALLTLTSGWSRHSRPMAAPPCRGCRTSTCTQMA